MRPSHNLHLSLQSLLVDKDTFGTARQQAGCDKPNQTWKLFPQKDKVNKIYLAPHPISTHKRPGMPFFPPLLDLQLVRKQCLYNQDRDLAQGVRSGIPHLQVGLPAPSSNAIKTRIETFG